MHKHPLSLLTSVFAAGIAFAPALAHAQEPAAPAPAAPAPAAAPAAPVAEPAAEASATTTAEVPAAPAAPEEAAAPPAEAPAAPAEEATEWPAGWFRFDQDSWLGTQFWFGATHKFGDFELASDVYFDGDNVAELDVGFNIHAGPLLFTPMAGIAIDWTQRKPSTLVAPQLFTYGDFDKIYLEWWSQFFFNTVFQSQNQKDAIGSLPNTWYNRVFLLYNVSDWFGIGPSLEATVALNDAAKLTDENGDTKSLTSLAPGLLASVNYGENNTLQLMGGYETVKEARGAELGTNQETGEPYVDPDLGFVGRFTFIRTW